MSTATLKYSRLLAPGVLVLVGMLPLLNNLAGPDGLKELSDLGLGIAAAIFLGALYDMSGVRKKVTKEASQRMVDLICRRMAAMCDESPAPAGPEQKKVMNVFWAVVDNDESLRQKSYRVRLNGFIWTTSADFVVIALPFGIAYYVYGMASDSLNMTIAGLVAIIASGLIWASGYPRVVRKHLALEEDQLELIEQNHRSEVCNRLKASQVQAR